MARKERPPLPKNVKMGAYTFRVTDNPELLDHVSNVSGKPVAGFSTMEQSVIAVRTDGGRSHAYMADTLLHELLHMALAVGGFELGDEALEEHVICAMTPTLLHSFRENPAMVAFLTHKE